MFGVIVFVGVRHNGLVIQKLAMAYQFCPELIHEDLCCEFVPTVLTIMMH